MRFHIYSPLPPAECTGRLTGLHTPSVKPHRRSQIWVEADVQESDLEARVFGWTPYAPGREVETQQLRAVGRLASARGSGTVISGTIIDTVITRPRMVLVIGVAAVWLWAAFEVGNSLSIALDMVCLLAVAWAAWARRQLAREMLLTLAHSVEGTLRPPRRR